MRLSKLTLQGFKSFADRTEFTFDDSLTGVVGPNGCGKSNVVDAIKWVLGERSSKSLRGTEMMDVIFAGSAGRKPAGMASVTLSFENPVIESPAPEATESEATSPDVGTEDEELGAPESRVVDSSVRRRRRLPIDADVVEIERRLHRDGGSDYFINQRRARLRDIRELFLDTGVGADAYSIIEQGKVDAMLLANPQERRVIFEEAAGIARFKQRRSETQRKLERTEQNLAVSREQLDSAERRLRLIKGQAAKARKFKELDEQLRAWRLTLAFEQYDDLIRRLEGLTSRQAELESVRRESVEQLAEAEHEKQAVEMRRHELADALKQVERELLAAEHARAQAEQRAEMTTHSASQLRGQMESEAARADELRERLSQSESTLEQHRSLVGELAERLAAAEQELARAVEERSSAAAGVSSAQSQLQQLRSGLARMERERASLESSLHADRTRIEQLQEQADRAGAREQSRREEAEAAATALREASTAVEQSRSQIAASQRELADREAALNALAGDRARRAREVSELEQEAVRLESRRSVLREMDERHDGFGDAVRDVLRRRDRNEPGFGAVVSPLAELIAADADSAAIVEAALGRKLQSIVVGSARDLPAEHDLAALPGRVEFLPLAGHGAAQPAADASDLLDLSNGRVRSVRSMVRPVEHSPSATAELLDRVLGSTYAVRGVEEALLLGAGPLRGARFVTPDGLLVEPDGTVVAGRASAATEGAGVLQRRAEAGQLDARLSELLPRLESLRSALRDADTEAASMNAAAAALGASIAGAQRTLAVEQSKCDRLASDQARLAREIAAAESERRELANRIERLSAEAESLRTRSESLARLIAEESTKSAALEAETAAAQARAEESGERVAAVRVEVGRLNEQSQNARREASRLQALREEDARRLRDLEQRAGEHAARASELEAVITRAREEFETAARLIEEHRAGAFEAAARVKEAEAAAEGLGERWRAARQRAAMIDRDWSALELSKRELEVKRETAEDRASQDLGLTIAAEYPEFRALLDTNEVVRIDQAHAAIEIDALRDQIRKLGNVNLDALEEETQLESANVELARQVADLDAAAGEMRVLIDRLSVVCRERFGEAFELIRSNFGGKDGMFRRLFGGGHAEVKLMPLVREVDGPEGPRRVETDETDLLESGIEIIAKPPGKEPRSISQLSGGEKTLTAVALLMSIFRSKPSCFCVLDEVDAALDEANVGRYNAMVRQFTDRSHFIVITHNKRTMQNMDRLYGVTMQERGVSKRVSVRFEQVKHDGSFTQDEAAPAPEAPASEPAALEVITVPEKQGAAAASRASTGLRAALAAMRAEGATENAPAAAN